MWTVDIVRPTVRRLLVPSLLAVGAFSGTGYAMDDVGALTSILDQRYGEPTDTGWSFNIDNDAFSTRSGDRDYTGGFSVTLHGRRARHATLSLDPALGWLNRRLPLPEPARAPAPADREHALQFGIMVFTPDDITAGAPMRHDRPYASLAYLGNTRYALRPDRRVAYQSTLTVGVLGLAAVEWIHKRIHAAAGAARPMGYANQIADGGEPTIGYAFARHALLAQRSGGRRDYDLSLTVEGSVGYLTEVSTTLGIRTGRIGTPWWSAVSRFGGYAAQPAAASRRMGASLYGRERYFWAGIKVRARAYNAFLQGQFRDSAVTFSPSELNRVVGELAVGYTTEMANLQLTYALRYNSAEIKNGYGARNIVWGSVSLSQYF